MRLDFALSNAGVGSRKNIKSMVAKKNIFVNGSPAKSASDEVSEDDEICVCGKKINIKQFVYIMMNKPAGYVCTTEKTPDSVLSLIPPELFRRDIAPVGRLDKDTTGLLILTNDGDFAHELISPKKMHNKVYFATLERTVTDEDIAAFEKGMTLADGEKTMPARLERTDDLLVVRVTLCEGKYHQIKRMFGARNNSVRSLFRFSVGQYSMPCELKEGMCVSIEKKS